MVQDVTGAGKALEAVERMTREGRELMHTLLGPSFEQLGAVVGDRIGFWRWKKWVRIVEASQRILAERGIDASAVPPKFLLPIVDNGSLEDDEDLVTRWAGLLATAAAGNLRRTGYPRILAELTSLDVQILDYLYEQLPHRQWFNPEVLLTVFGDEYLVAADNLLRLGVCVASAASVSPAVGPHWVDIRVTPLGIDFVNACRAGPQSEEGA